MKKFEVKVADKNNKKSAKIYTPVAEDSMEAFEWGEKQAEELFGSKGTCEVMGEVKDE